MSDVADRSERANVAVHASFFAGGTLLSRILGLARDILIARYFSVDVRDAFVNAFRLPNLFRRLLGEGSLSVSFIPVFVSLLQGKRREESHRLVNSVFAILLVVAVSLSLLGIVFMDSLLGLVLSGQEYVAVPGKLEMTVHLARIMFAFVALISTYAFFMAVLNSLKRFALTALAPCFFNVTVILGTLFSVRTAFPEEALAWSVIAGGFVQMLILVPAVVRAGYFPRPSLQWSSMEVHRVMKAVIPSLLGMSVMQLTQVVNMHFASYLPKGSHSALYFADRILEFPLSIIAVSVGAALLPTLSRQHAGGDHERMAETINHYLRLVLFIALPAGAGLFVLASPIAEVLFVGRQFTFADAERVAIVIQVYGFGLIVASIVRILAQGFYAVHNTWYPALAASVAIVAHIFFAASLTRVLGLHGLAIATVMSGAVNMTMLAVAYNKWVARIDVPGLLKSLLKFSVALVVLIAVVQLYRVLLGEFGSERATKTSALFLTIGLSAAGYLLAAHVLRIEEFHETLATFKAKLAKRR